MSIVHRSRCIRYTHNGHADTAKLRGSALFKMMRIGMAGRRLLGGHGHVRIGTSIEKPCSDELMFLLMPGTSQVADYVEWAARSPFRSTIIDVHADVLQLLTPSQWDVDMMVSHDGRGDHAAWEWWAGGEPQAALRRSIAAADVVTTPWPQLVEPLRELNPTVELLPDLTVEDSASFVTGFRRIAKSLSGPAA